MGEDDSEDEFDDNTLLEIATLLGTSEEDIPSRHSIFKGAVEEDLVDQYDFESLLPQKKDIVKFMPIRPLTKIIDPIMPVEQVQSLGKSEDVEEHISLRTPSKFRAINEIEYPTDNLRGSSTIATVVTVEESEMNPIISRNRLWSSQQPPDTDLAGAMVNGHSGALWSAKAQAKRIEDWSVAHVKNVENSLEELVHGIIPKSTGIKEFGKISATLTVPDVIRRKRLLTDDASPLTTKDLWQRTRSKHHVFDWMLESSQKAQEPLKELAFSTQSQPEVVEASMILPSAKAFGIPSREARLLKTVSKQKGNLEDESHIEAPSQVNQDLTTANEPVVRPLTNVGRVSSVLASRSMWEAMGPAKYQDSSVPKPAKASSLRPKAAKLTMTKMPRPKASAGDWKMELSRAIHGGYLEPTKPVQSLLVEDLSTFEEVRSTSQRIASSEMEDSQEPSVAKHGQDAKYVALSSPTSIPTINPRYDSSVRHPVFFGKSMETLSLSVHPAALGYAREAPVAPENIQTSSSISLWRKTAPPISVENKISSTWVTPTIIDFVEEIGVVLAVHKGNPRRPASVLHQDVLAIESNNLFKMSTATPSSPVHWLHSTSATLPTASTWTKPARPLASSKELQPSMWTNHISQRVVQHTSTIVVAPLSRLPRKSSSNTDLSILTKLQSTSLFTTKAMVAETVTKNWLHETTINTAGGHKASDVSMHDTSSNSIDHRSSMYSPLAPEATNGAAGISEQPRSVEIPRAQTWTLPETTQIEPKLDVATSGLWDGKTARTESLKGDSEVRNEIVYTPPRKQRKGSINTALARVRSDTFWVPQAKVAGTSEKNWLNASTVKRARPVVIIPEAPDLVKDDMDGSGRSGEDEPFYLSPMVYSPPVPRSKVEQSKMKSLRDDSDGEVDDEEVDRMGEDMMGRELWRYSKSVGAESVALVREEYRLGKRSSTALFQ